MKIINKQAFEEAQIMARMAEEMNKQRQPVVYPSGYWEAAMIALREAYYG